MAKSSKVSMTFIGACSSWCMCPVTYMHLYLHTCSAWDSCALQSGGWTLEDLAQKRLRVCRFKYKRVNGVKTNKNNMPMQGWHSNRTRNLPHCSEHVYLSIFIFRVFICFWCYWKVLDWQPWRLKSGDLKINRHPQNLYCLASSIKEWHFLLPPHPEPGGISSRGDKVTHCLCSISPWFSSKTARSGANFVMWMFIC